MKTRLRRAAGVFLALCVVLSSLIPSVTVTASSKLLGADDTTAAGNQGSNYFILDRWTATATGNITEIRVKCGASGEVKLAIYADSSGSPGALLNAVNTSTLVSSGWNTINFPSTAVTSGTSYWLAFNSSASCVNYVWSSGRSRLYKRATYSTFTFPNPAGTGFSSYSRAYNLIAGWGTTGAPPPTTAPTVTNSTGATNTTSTSARLNGEVTSTGGENPTVYIYWGPSDGGTTPGNWANSVNLGTKPAGTFYTDISGLSASTTYYYRCFAQNSAGSDWADATTAFTTGISVASQKVLILYDSGGNWGWLGEIYAQLTANLLGHFDLPYTAKNVANYTAGELETHIATFYIGHYYDNPGLGQAFLSDVMATNKPVIWFKYNIWKITTDPNFTGKFGFTFNGLDSSGYPTISYKGQTFSKYSADPEIGLTTIVDTQKAKAVATAANSSGSSVPYIVKGGNLWYVADIPFSYISEEDRYLVFCDVLHDMLGINHSESLRALVRIEDVNPTSDPQELRAIADYLYSQGVPFAVSVVPFYTDPLGYYSEGVPESLLLSRARGVTAALRYMVSKGGVIVLHGYSHQYDSIANPYSGVSTDDFEFYRVTRGVDGSLTYEGPVPEDSRTWVQGRINKGIRELKRAGLSTQIFEAPHYAASALDYSVFATNFAATYHRVLYFQGRFTSAKKAILRAPGGDTGLPKRSLEPAGGPDHFGSQFFPYVIQKDVYGQKVLPENLGNIEPEPWEIYPARLPADIIRAAQKNKAIRDGWASFYFHPFFDIQYLKDTVQGIKSLGYTFVTPSPTLR